MGLPVNPGGQRQINPFTWSTHDPPFWHGLLIHSLTSVSQLAPAKERKVIKTRSTQRPQTSAERQHSRIAVWFLQCKLAMQLWSESTRYFVDNPVNPDFGLRTPGSWRWFGSSPKFNHLVPGPYPTPPRNFAKIRSQLFQLSNGQTNTQTNRLK